MKRIKFLTLVFSTTTLATVMLVVGLLGTAVYLFARPLWVPVAYKVIGKRTVDEVMVKYGAEARERLAAVFDSKAIAYPPASVTFLVSKADERLEVWATDHGGARFVRAYPIQALSGGPGPKLREGDRQVPEGIYRIVGLNPNSAYHLSMKLDYPNAFDLEHARREGRTEPGSNIFIHGKAVSIGCLAMGDEAIEELFTLTVDAGMHNVEVVIAPQDPRVAPLPAPPSPVWAAELYRAVATRFDRFRAPQP